MVKLFVAGLMLALAGFVGFVAHHESKKTRGPAAGSADDAEVSTISTGQRVDVDAHIAAKDLTIVEFTAEF